MRQLRIPFYASLPLLILIVFVGTSVYSQSGRRKDQVKAPRVGPGPVADPTVPGNRPASSKPTSKTGKSSVEEVHESDIIRVSSVLVPIPASVVDPKGVAITGLQLEDFELWVDGQVRPLSALTRSETPVRMAMLFDNSGSLDAAREFEKRAAVDFFRKVMRPKDEAAVFSIETDSYLAQPLTNDVARLEQTILGFGRPAGSTSLFDAVIDAAAYLRPYGGRRVLKIVSDGIETTSQADFATTMQRVLYDDCQIFIVQTGLYEGANLRALAAERRMEELASQTGGAAFIPKTTADLEHAFEQIAADLAQQYVLSYYPGEQQRDGRFHPLELKLKTRKDIRVRSRKGYYSRKPSSVATNDW
ncbi:MAG TPA: VWA domain-containing protein [Pyrinomonadaceae bacterium]